jgi:hypothetical protein
MFSSPTKPVASFWCSTLWPQGTTQGELVFYNVQGIEVKRFKVDNTFSSLLISTTDIAAGTYYYQMQINGDASATKKMVVVK